MFGAPEGIRTPGLLIRSQTLYPAELQAHITTPNTVASFIVTKSLWLVKALFTGSDSNKRQNHIYIYKYTDKNVGQVC